MKVVKLQKTQKVHKGAIFTFCKLTDKEIISGGADDYLRFSEISNDGSDFRIMGATKSPHFSVLSIHKSLFNKILTIGVEGGLTVWDIDITESLPFQLSISQQLSISNTQKESNANILELNNGEVITWGFEKHPPVVWQPIFDGDSFRNYRFRHAFEDETITTIAIDPSGLVLTGNAFGVVGIYDKNYKLFLQEKISDSAIRVIKVMDKLWIVGGDNKLFKLLKWNPSNLELSIIFNSELHNGSVHSVYISSSGNIISSDDGIKKFLFFITKKPQYVVWYLNVDSELSMIESRVGIPLAMIEDNYLIIDNLEGYLDYRKIVRFGSEDSSNLFCFRKQSSYINCVLCGKNFLLGGDESGSFSLWKTEDFRSIAV